jgi:uncharacterized protein (TIGR02996 family)
MDDERRLIDAIVAAPEDDAPRIVYADWLQQRGDPRGELIQLQCQLAGPEDERRRSMRIAENKLLADYALAWTKPLHEVLPEPPPAAQHEFTFARGFVDEATLSLACLPHLGALLERAPMLRRLRLRPNGMVTLPLARPVIDKTFASPHLLRITSLEVSLPGGGNAIAEAIAGMSELANLRELAVHASIWGDQVAAFAQSRAGLMLDDAGALALAGSPHLAKVEKLSLEGNFVGIAGAHAVARAPWKLRELELGNNAIEGLEPGAIARALDGQACAGLEVLSLAGIALATEDLAAIAATPTFANLRDLDLEKCQVGKDGIAAFCNALALPALRRLRLERNSLGDAGAQAIATCAALAELTSLEAGHNRFGHKGAAALAASPHLSKLARLTLNEPRWKPETKKLFTDSPTLANARIYLEGRLLARKKR